MGCNLTPPYLLEGRLKISKIIIIERDEFVSAQFLKRSLGLSFRPLTSDISRSKRPKP